MANPTILDNLTDADSRDRLRYVRLVLAPRHALIDAAYVCLCRYADHRGYAPNWRVGNPAAQSGVVYNSDRVSSATPEAVEALDYLRMAVEPPLGYVTALRLALAHVADDLGYTTTWRTDRPDLDQLDRVLAATFRCQPKPRRRSASAVEAEIQQKGEPHA